MIANFIKKHQIFRLDHILVYLFSFAIFFFILLLDVRTDIRLHVEILINLLSKGILPTTPLYYITIWILAFFQLNHTLLLVSAIIVLAFSVTFKYIISLKSIIDITGLEDDNRVTRVLYFLLLLVIPLYIGGKYFYVGKIGINQWHNSTAIFLMPFAIAMFLSALKFLRDQEAKWLYCIAILGVLNVLTKPSYFFVFAPTFLLMCGIRCGLNKKLIGPFLSLIAPMLSLIGVYFYTFHTTVFSHIYEEESEVIISPFTVWGHFSENMPFDFLLSIAFPLSFLLFYFAHIKRHQALWFALVQFVAAVIMFIFLAESGPRLFHGNFLWQAVICNYMLFMVCLALFMKINLPNGWSELKFNYRNIITGGIFILHSICGLAYIVHIFLVQKYF